ncbi:MAG: twitch domain-containing radical SAM protein [Bacteriovoracia bacterium]
MTKFICALPWHHLMFQPDGSAYTCCAAKFLPDQENLLGKLPDDSIHQIWQHPFLHKIRSEMLAGKVPQQCKNCALKEAGGMISDRITSNRKFELQLPLIIEKNSADVTNEDLVSIDLRTSNVCNFACRTCSPVHSSKWILDYALVTGKAWPIETATKSFQTLAQAEATFRLANFKPERMFFAGGEPLLHREHYTILEIIHELNPKCRVEYVTNLSTLGMAGIDVVAMWNKFENVDLNISIDGIGALGEYIRDGQSWNQLEANIARIRREAPHVTLGLISTVSNLSIASLIETLDYCLNKLQLNHNVLLTPVIDPTIYSVTTLPLAIKEKLKEQIKTHLSGFTPDVQEQLKGVIGYMDNQDDSDQFKVFLRHNERLDYIRSQDFNKVSPLPQMIRELP